MSLSCSIVCHKFCMYKGKSYIGTLSLVIYDFLECSSRYLRKLPTAAANDYFY